MCVCLFILVEKQDNLSQLNEWVTGLGSNTTLVVLVPRHHDVTFHSPTGCPGVLDQPVIFSLVCSIANSEYTMIELSAAAVTVE